MEKEKLEMEQQVVSQLLQAEEEMSDVDGISRNVYLWKFLNF